MSGHHHKALSFAEVLAIFCCCWRHMTDRGHLVVHSNSRWWDRWWTDEMIHNKNIYI